MAELKSKADSGGGTVSFKGPATTTSNAAVQLTLPVDDGTTGQYLKTDGSGALSWATVSSTPEGTAVKSTGEAATKFLRADGDNTCSWQIPDGKIKQVVSGTYSTQTGTTNSSYTDSGLTLNITPANGTKVLVIVSIGAYTYRSGHDSTRGLYNIMRDTTQITQWVHGIDADTDDSSVSAQSWTAVTRTHLDTHGADGSTAVTYKVQMKKDEGTGIYMSWNNYPSSIILMEVAA